MRIRLSGRFAALALAMACPCAAAAQDIGPSPKTKRVEGSVGDLLRAVHEERNVEYLTAPLYYCENTTGRMYTVPAGFVTDRASVPPEFADFVAKSGRTSDAAILHDWFYAIGEPGGKYEADRIFLNALAETGVPGFTRDQMWFAIWSVGGGYKTKTDWMFVDLKTGEVINHPPPKPERVPFEQGRACADFPDYMRRQGASREQIAKIRIRKSEIRFLSFIRLPYARPRAVRARAGGAPTRPE